MTIREKIARWLFPDLAKNAARYRFLLSELEESRWWLSEFQDIGDALQRLIDRDFEHWRSLIDDQFISTTGNITNFREMLRRRNAAQDVSRIRADLSSVLKANARQAACIHQCAGAIGADTAATIDGLPRAVKHLVEQLRLAREGAADEKVVHEILQAVSDVVVDARVSWPAGREACHMIEYDEEELRQKVVAALSYSRGEGEVANG